jgi:hypothetical protein
MNYTTFLQVKLHKIIELFIIRKMVESKGYSIESISQAIAFARDGVRPEKAGGDIVARVNNAMIKARGEAGNFWKQRGKGHAVFYDPEHTAAILDALADTVQGRMGKGARRDGITPDVLAEAERKIFNVED